MAITNGDMGVFSEISNSLHDDSLFANMDLDLASFAQPTPPSSTIMGTGTPSGALVASPLVDQLLLNQLPHDMGALTPTPQGNPPDKELSSQLQPSTHLSLAAVEQGLIKRPSILVEHVHSPLRCYIPSSFSPLKIVGDYFVDDSKYKAGGRFVYKKLYKRRKSSIPTPFSPYRRESRLLPFYQPGKDQEWIIPLRKEKPPKPKPRSVSLSVNWLSYKKEDTASQKQQIQYLPTIKDPAVAATAWGISTLSLQHEKIKEDDESSSDSDSDSSSTSTGDSDEEGSIEPPQPRFGKLIKRFSAISLGSNNGSSVARWCVRSVNSAMFVDAVMSQSTDHSIGGVLMGLGSSAARQRNRPVTGARLTELESGKERAKPWPSAEDYHSEVEFDTPFTPAILSAAPPALVSEPTTIQDSLAAEYFLEAVKTLCEQAVMGDYPFAGSNEVTGTSGEITEGESFHAMLARRKTMSEFLHEGK